MSGFDLISRSRRGGGKVGIPRTLRDFQAWWESRLFDFSTMRLFHGLAGRNFRIEHWNAALVVATEGVRPIAEAQGSIQMLVHHHRAARQGASPAHRLDLQSQIFKTHRVVPVHCAFELQRKDALQVFPRYGTNALPVCAALTWKRRLNSAM